MSTTRLARSKARGYLPAVEDVRTSLISSGVDPALKTMTLDKVFWSHFATNLAPAGWVLGAVIAGVGLDTAWGCLAIVLGNVLGTLPVALCSTIGPRTGFTQIETSRFSFGRLGTRVPAALNWLGAIAWDAVNNVPSTLALIALVALAGWAPPFWFALAIVAASELVVGMCGHDLVQAINKYLGFVLLIVYAIAGVMAVKGAAGAQTAHAHVTPATFVLGMSLAAGFTIAFAPFSSDYTRYLPATTLSRRVAVLGFIGLASSGIAMEIFGLLTASRMQDLGPRGVITSIAQLTGSFGWLALAAIALSAVTINSINGNTAAYSLMSAGVRLPRHLAALVTACLGYLLAVAGAGAFAELFANYMLVLLYWISPWAGIVVTDWFFFRDVPNAAARKWGAGTPIFAVVTVLTIGLFSSTEVYTGPVARALGGTDIGYFVGFFAAAALYALRRRQEKTTAPI